MSPKRSGIATVLTLLLIGGSLLCVALLSPDQNEPETRPLKVGKKISGELRGGERHLFRLSIEHGQAFRIILDSRRNDFVLTLIDPFHSTKLLIDTRNGLRGLEFLYAVADSHGYHLLEVRSHAPAGTEGSYSLKVDRPHFATRSDRLRQAATAALSRGEILFASGHGTLEKAVAEYSKALDLSRRAAEPELAIAVGYRLGRARESLREYEQALNTYRSALAGVRFRGDRLAEACLLDRMGRCLYDKERPIEAKQFYQRSLDLFRLEKYRPGEADVLNNLGLVYTREGNFPDGIMLIVQSLKIWEELGGVSEQVYIRQNLGYRYIALEEPDKAYDQFESALKLSVGREDLRARALGGIGATHVELGRTDLAIPELAEAVALWRELGDRREEVVALIRLAEAHTQRRELAEARRLLEEALGLARRKPVNDRYEGMVLGNLGHVLDLQGRGREALIHFDQARSVFENDPGSLVRVLRGRAEAALRLGDLDLASKDAQEAIARLELLRSPHPMDFSLRRSLYDLHVEILMRMHDRKPDENHVIAAFNAAEAIRSRSLLDDVKTLQADLEPDDPKLLAEKADLEESLRRLTMHGGAPQERRTTEIEREIRDVETRLGVVRTKLEGRGLAGSPRALTLPEVQRSLGADTLLLVYFLGKERSLLWEVTSDRFVMHKLANRPSEIEEQAEKVYQQLARNSPREWRHWMPALKKLSKMLLAPVAERLEQRQLLISPDGVLHLAPFAALLDPRTLERTKEPGTEPGSPRFLVLDHRLATIPSVSAVTATREALSRRLPALGGVAVLAAPDFAGRFEPLDYSVKEAEAIVRLAPPGRSFLAKGRQASRATAMNRSLGSYSYLHFATHGVLEDRPDLSGIALSSHDQQDGFLRAFEIYDLNLSAELVVLSACETALGAERGGLVRAFLQAGSRRVMATLWKVPDHSTPKIMESFYQGLLRQGMTPSAALQQAQIQMLDSRWKAPHYWAGFVLQGEWR